MEGPYNGFAFESFHLEVGLLRSI